MLNGVGTWWRKTSSMTPSRLASSSLGGCCELGVTWNNFFKTAAPISDARSAARFIFSATIKTRRWRTNIVMTNGILTHGGIVKIQSNMNSYLSLKVPIVTTKCGSNFIWNTDQQTNQ
jgi:hypothetical protein